MAYNKYGAKKTYSELCRRQFDSKLEARRADQLFLLETAGVISDLEFQKRIVLSDIKNYRVTITIDFKYVEDGVVVWEDAKGKMMSDFRVKLAWLKKYHDIEVRIWKG